MDGPCLATWGTAEGGDGGSSGGKKTQRTSTNELGGAACERSEVQFIPTSEGKGLEAERVERTLHGNKPVM